MKLLLTIVLLASAMGTLARAEDTANPTPVTTVVVGDKKILADRNGLTAYVFDVDALDLSKCYDSCAKFWPAILLKAGEKTAAPYGETARKDGSRQITLNHRPIYRFANDSAPRETKGDGLQGVWHIIIQK
ncbi:MAG: COG4315 family predicted lipoprotein [Bdellovibrionota bacterium]